MKSYMNRRRRTNRISISPMQKKGRNLRTLCGSGRFPVPFLERGFDISGMDLSEEMLEKLKQKAPNARVIQADIIDFTVQEKFDYIFIPSGTISLFTDIECVQTCTDTEKGKNT